MAGTGYFGQTAVQPRDHIPVNTMRKSRNHTQDGVQTVKSHGIRNGYYIVCGTRIVSVLLRRTQIYINLLCFSFFSYYFFLSIFSSFSVGLSMR